MIIGMAIEQGALFDNRKLKGQKAQSFSITPPVADMTVHATLPAYHAYLGSAGYSTYTPDDFTADLKLFGQFTGSKHLTDIQGVDVQQWIRQLKETMPAKTVSRKVSAVGNYFRWLDKEKVLEHNPAKGIRAARVSAPLPDILFDNECDQLLAVASKDPRIYMLVLLLLETGLKTAELFAVKTTDFDFSNTYQPELWVRHEGKQAYKDRRLKLPKQIIDVFNDYVEQYHVTNTLFPYSERFISMLLIDTAKVAGITKKVTPGALRDVCVVHGINGGEKPEAMFEKIGLAKNSYDDARKKYGRLTRKAL
jgi:integrase/recombinase XerD